MSDGWHAELLIRRDPNRAAIVQKIDTAMAKLRPKRGFQPWYDPEEARLKLLHAIEEYTKSRQYAAAIREAEDAGADKFDRVAETALDLADMIAESGDNERRALGIIRNADALVAKLRGLARAAADTNVQLWARRRPKGRGRPDNEDRVLLAQKAAVIFEACTGKVAGYTKPTQAGEKRSGPAIDFVTLIFEAAGITSGAANCLIEARERILALRGAEGRGKAENTD
jgi:hypothetical protein